MKRGFTVVEVLVTLIILAILLGLGTVGLRSTLANGRDAERQADVEILARGFENYYERGNPYYVAGVSKGTYPGANQLISIEGSGWCSGALFNIPEQNIKYSKCAPGAGYWAEALPGVTDAALTPPDKTGRELRSTYGIQPQDLAAWKTTELNAGKYVYHASHQDGSVCYDEECFSFELSYKKETTGEIVTVKSKRQ